ncbi:MAG: inorganic phosphate transporter [Bacteroidales bacterium]|nr:inorganic phosphate transporter [Bacteroidales bacterium]
MLGIRVQMLIPILIPLLVGMFLAINMGGSGTAPAFSVAYGSNIIKKLAIPGLFGLFVFLGAILGGEKVALTLGKGLLPAEKITITVTTIILFSVSISLLIANLLGVPQSTSQSTVLSISGTAVYFESLNTHKLFFEIVPTWFILPLIGFIITYISIKLLKKRIQVQNKLLDKSLSKYSFRRLFLIATACYVAFSIGTNNVANATGPLVSMMTNELQIDPADTARYSLLLIVATLVIAPCFGIGSSIFGYKVLKTNGKDITSFGPLEASVISLVTATLLLAASLVKGIPTSLVQLNSFAIMAVGVEKTGWKVMMNNNTVRKFWFIWIVAPMFAFSLSLLLTYLADLAGLLYY